MNTKLMHRVADTIERLEFGREPGTFKMSDYTHWLADSCHSPACIAGWTCFLADGTVPLDADRPDESPAHDRASDLLGVNDSIACKLFAPQGQIASYMAPPGAQGYISPERAAATLRRLADTGVVDWGAEA